MEKTTKSLRLQVGILGRTNVGKSSFLNRVAGQDVSITSAVPGTTTDVVEKAMEFHDVGPVLFLDTAGVDDDSELGVLRRSRTEKVLDRSDAVVLVLEPNVWTPFEEGIVESARAKGIPVIAVVNKTDLAEPAKDFLAALAKKVPIRLSGSSRDGNGFSVAVLERALARVLEGRADPAARKLLSDLLPAGGSAVLVVPIDPEAPKGRIKMLQVQAIRELLDHRQAALVLQETEYAAAMASASRKPDLVVCDSPVAAQVFRETPASVPCTTFSILMARFKGDLATQVRGVSAIDRLEDGDRVLVAEACTHHAIDGDIGRIRIPEAIRRRTGKDVQFEICPGKDLPKDLSSFRMIIHCGACMLTAREMGLRLEAARAAGVPITNYGVCLTFLQGLLDRALSPFPVLFPKTPEGDRREPRHESVLR